MVNQLEQGKAKRERDLIERERKSAEERLD
jgi:hypothetical protein